MAIDSCIFIYELDQNPSYLAWTREVFSWLELPGHSAVTSTISMTEILTGPYSAGNVKRARMQYAILSRYPTLQWIPPDLAIAHRAARLRAQYRLRTPDAIQASTALHLGVLGFITNDPIFKRLDGFETLLLDDLI